MYGPNGTTLVLLNKRSYNLDSKRKNQFLMIEFRLGQSNTIQVFNATGNALFEIEVNGNYTLDVASYPSGIYLVTVWDASTNERQSLKMVMH